jgi:hypothetical protein
LSGGIRGGVYEKLATMEPGVFQLQLPANVVWEKEMEILPDNAKYAATTPEVAAKTFGIRRGR